MVAALAGASLTLLSCSQEVHRPPGISVGGSAPVAHPHEPDGYPAGPYGGNNPQVGDVIQDMSFLGYLGTGERIEPSSDLSEFSFSSLREGEAQFLLIHVSSLWCGTCRAEAIGMSEYTSQIVDAGGLALEILIDGQTAGLDPSQEELDVWVLNNDLRMTTVLPGDNAVRRVFPDQDFVYIIDLESMEVVWQQEGPSIDPTTTQIGAREILASYLTD